MTLRYGYHLALSVLLMTTYVPLGSRLASVTTAMVKADDTQRNTGNWTVTYHPDDMNVPGVPFFEVCHIVINGAAGSTFTVFIENQQWDTNQNGQANSWDPAVPLPLRPGQWLYFFWSNPATDGNPPTVTIWLRYDIDIPANRSALIGMNQGQS